MMLLFTTTNKPVSRLIRWIFREPASHFAVCFDDKIVIQSTIIGGASMDWYGWFKEENKIISTLEPIIQMTLAEEESFYQKILSAIPERPSYDWKAFWSLGINKIFGRGYKEAEECPKKLICTEIAKTFGFINDQYLAVTPWQLHNYFVSTGLYREVV